MKELRQSRSECNKKTSGLIQGLSGAPRHKFERNFKNSEKIWESNRKLRQVTFINHNLSAPTVFETSIW